MVLLVFPVLYEAWMMTDCTGPDVNCGMAGRPATRLAEQQLQKRESKEAEHGPISDDIQKQRVAQLVKKFRAFYGTRRFIPVFTRARHRSLS
jgi:hypothetical protein